MQKTDELYYKYMGELQQKHRNADPEKQLVVNLTFDKNPNVRQATAIESKISLPDRAEVPTKTSDSKIIYTIASELRKAIEVKMNPIERDGYENQYTMEYDDKFGNKNIVLIPKAVERFNEVLNAKIETHYTATGKKIPDKFFQIYPKGKDGQIVLTGTNQILEFIRKTAIYEAFEEGRITKEEKVDLVKTVCSLLIKMHSHEDVKQNNHELEQSRMIFNNFVMKELTKDFFHKEKDEKRGMIADKSDKYYFQDKRYREAPESLERNGIKRKKNIHFDIEARAKSNKSVERKGIYDPKLTGASALNDIGGMRFIGDTEDELNILMVNQLMKYHNNHFKYNPALKAFPHGTRKEEETGKPYSQEDINKIINLMGLKIKDKGVVKTICIKEGSKTNAAVYELDRNFFAKHGISDPFILAQLERVVEEKNQNALKEFKEGKKDKGELQVDLLKEIIIDEYPQYKSATIKPDDIRPLYGMIKKSNDIKEEIEKVKKEQLIGTAGDSIESTKNKKMIYTKTTNGYTITSRGQVFDVEEILNLADNFIDKWREKETFLKKKPGGNIKIGASDRKEGKIEGDIYTNDGQKFSGEHQFITKETIKNMMLMTVAEVYDNIKVIFETMREEKILSKKHITQIVKNRLIPMINKCDVVQNGISGKELLERMVSDDTILPAGGSITDKIIHELVENRGMRTLTINKVPQKGLYVNPAFVKRLKGNNNNLRLD